MIPKPIKMVMTMAMIHFRYCIQQSRMSGEGVRAALTLFRFPSFDGDVEDSHNFDVDALGSFSVVTGEGNDWVEAEAIGREVFKGARPPICDSLKRLLMAACDLGLGGGGGAFLSTNS
jgi:hypothetical protein